MQTVPRSLSPVAEQTAELSQFPMPATNDRVVVATAVIAPPDIRATMLATYRNRDLTDPNARRIDDLMRRMQDDGTPVDQVTIIDYGRRHGLLDGPGAVHLGSWLSEAISKAPVPLSGTWYVVGLLEDAARRNLGEAADELHRVRNSASMDDLERVVREQYKLMMQALAKAKVAAK